MGFNKFCAVALTTMALAAAGAASAASLGDTAQYLPSTEAGYSASVTYTSATAGAYLTSFDIIGYKSLDGANGYFEDDFTLTVNGTDVFHGTFDLGGGGTNLSTAPGHVSVHSLGKVVTVSGLPVELLSGVNTFTFTYASPTNGGLYGGGFAGDQGTDDEAWGVKNINVSAAPEPSAWALMMVGVGGMGAALRTRRRHRAVA